MARKKMPNKTQPETKENTMAKKDLTEIVCVIDRSGSMSAMCAEAIGGFNSFLDDQKKEEGEAKLTLVLFDHEYMKVHDGAPIADVAPLNTTTYEPRGTTALLDAVGRTIDDVGKRLSDLTEEERPEKVIVSIMTDGFENASKDYSLTKVRDMIAHQTDMYQWEFVFLGATLEANKMAADAGIPLANIASFTSTGAGVRAAYADISTRTAAYRKGSTKA
jgi:uncharacterized protein YegL